MNNTTKQFITDALLNNKINVIGWETPEEYDQDTVYTKAEISIMPRFYKGKLTIVATGIVNIMSQTIDNMAGVDEEPDYPEYSVEYNLKDFIVNCFGFIEINDLPEICGLMIDIDEKLIEIHIK